ncbi:MAG: HDIG domain-containing metalloprotein, partial [Myxococcota bacterium]
LALLVTPNLPFLTILPDVGEVATQDLKSPGEFLVEDVTSTEKERDEAEDAVRAVYDRDRGVADALDARLEAAFRSAREAIADSAAEGAAKERREAAAQGFLEAVGPGVPAASVARIADRGFSEEDAGAVRAIVDKALSAHIVANRELLQDQARKGITVREVQSREEHLVSDLDSIQDAEQARRGIAKLAAAGIGDIPAGRFAPVLPIARALVRPNLTFNRIETEERRSSARENVKPVTILLKKGEIIVRDGDPVTARHVMILDALRKQSLDRSVGTLFIAIALFILITTGTLYRFAGSGVRKFRDDTRSTVFFLAMLVLMVVMARVLLFIADAVGSAFPLIPPEAYRYAIPVAAGAMIVRMIRNSETAVFFAALLALVAGIMVERSFFFAIVTFLGSIVGAHAVGQVQSRSKIMMAGTEVGLMNAALLALWALMDGELLARGTLAGLIAGFAGGVGAAIVVTAFTPLAEWAMGTVTGLKLLELSNSDQPLLRELALKAPGTFHHSMIMANLVEAAAESIHANPLLARVSAYYHDVGKTLKPHYYVENMPPGENKHDNLSAAMSTRIVKAHVKEGIELARKHNLPEIII